MVLLRQPRPTGTNLPTQQPRRKSVPRCSLSGFYYIHSNIFLMLNRSITTSPIVYARLGGALYLTIILFGAFSEGFVNSKLMAGDAATTAHHILAS